MLRKSLFKSELLRGTAGSVFLTIIGLALNLSVGMILARTLGPSEYGIYAFALSLITLAALPTNAGLPTLLVREVAANQSKNKIATTKGLLAASNGFVLIYSAFVSIISFLYIYTHFSDSQQDHIYLYIWSLVLLPLISFEGVRTGALRGLKKITSAQIPGKIIRPLVLASLLLIASYYKIQLTATITMIFGVVSAVCAFLVGFYLLLKALPAQLNKTHAQYEFRFWAYSLLPFSLFSGISILDSQFTTIALGILGSEEDVGLFRVAATAASVVSLGLSAINMALAPQIVHLYKTGKLIELQKTITFTTRWAAVISVPAVLVFIFWGKELIEFIFGADFISAWPALVVLSLAQLVNSTCGSVALVLNMTGNERSTLAGAISGLFFNICLSVLFIPIYGIIGAAVGYAMSLTAWNLILIYITKRKTGLNTFLI